MLTEFAHQFEQLTGHPPFPWQRRLFDQLGQRPLNIPEACELPTGSGKTAVIACWLLALRSQPELPRRLVYVVNRRTVVDQTTDEVERYRVAYKAMFSESFAVSTLRGQFADNREWSADPSRPAVICGTVDLIGSRLLFSGYGLGRGGRAQHAGLLGQDTLVVHDEAHLEPAFQALLEAIKEEQRNGRFRDLRPLRIMALTATTRSPQDDRSFTLSPDEQAARPTQPGILGELGRRLHARKRLTLHELKEKAKLEDRVAEIAKTYKETGAAILIYLREVRSVQAVVKKLPRGQTRILTGTLRGLERDRLVNDPVFRRFLPRQAPADPQTVYLVCTSAGEVGVNLSADHLVCDLTPFDSMAQRFGRVNRFGRRDDTDIHVVYSNVQLNPEKPNAYAGACRHTLALLEKLRSNSDGFDGNANPASTPTTAHVRKHPLQRRPRRLNTSASQAP